MIKYTRKILFFTSLIFFLISAPVVILYSKGYYFDFEKKTFIKTGAIFLKTFPTRAQIYINDKFEKESGWLNGEILIKNLKVKEYKITVKKNGVWLWEKNLKVEAGLVTEAKNIKLFSANPKKEPVSNKEAAEIKTTEKPILPENSLAAAQSGNYIYYIENKNGQLWRMNLNKENKEQITVSPLPAFETIKDWPNNFSYQLIVSPQQKIVLIESNSGILYLFNSETRSFKKLAENIKTAEFSLDETKLLYTNDNELSVYFITEIFGQPRKKAGEQNLITRLSQKISSAFWLSDSEHIIFLSGSEIKIAEMDDRGQRNIINFISIKTPLFHYNPNNEKIYFNEEGKDYSVSLSQ